jgi:hypothetical protein
MTLEEVVKLVEIMAVVIAGGWAIYGFIVLRQREKASAELRRIDLESKNAEIEARAVAVLCVEISATSAPRPDGHGYCIFSEVTLNNVGKRDTRIKWKGEDPAFIVRRTEFSTNGAPQYPDPPIKIRVRQARDPNNEALSHVIRAGGTQRLTFVANVPTPGIYFVSFRGVLDPEEQGISFDAGTRSGNPVSWTSVTYVLISDTVDSSTRTTDG